MTQEDTPQNFMSQFFKPIDAKHRGEIIDNIRKSSSPGFDYFFLVTLSGAIATLGLIGDSPAVIIGAMLVAPLMSPILGVGLGSITADTQLVRNSLSALLRGAVLAVILSALITLSNIYLPFAPSLLDIPNEVLSRTQPTPNDLIIALAGGLAAAYALSQPHLSAALPGVAIATALMPPLSTIGIGVALGRWDIAGGAALLFLTNAVTISFAAILVFVREGFIPKHKKADGTPLKTLWGAGALTVLLLIPLTILGTRLVTQGQEDRTITNIIQSEISAIEDAELVDFSINRSEEELNIKITIYSNQPLTHNQVVALQKSLVNQLDKSVALIVNHIKSDTLDPLIPPTQTPSPTLTFTATVGPSPTKTITPTMTTTATKTATAQPSSTQTEIPPSPTPQLVLVRQTNVPPYYYLYQEPGGPVIAQLRLNSILYDLHVKQIYEGLLWIKVMDEDGRIGWIPEIYLLYPTLTPTLTITPSN